MIDHKGFLENRCQRWSQEKINSPFKKEYIKAFPLFIPPSGSKKYAFPPPLVFD